MIRSPSVGDVDDECAETGALSVTPTLQTSATVDDSHEAAKMRYARRLVNAVTVPATVAIPTPASA